MSDKPIPEFGEARPEDDQERAARKGAARAPRSAGGMTKAEHRQRILQSIKDHEEHVAGLSPVDALADELATLWVAMEAIDARAGVRFERRTEQVAMGRSLQWLADAISAEPPTPDRLRAIAEAFDRGEIDALAVSPPRREPTAEEAGANARALELRLERDELRRELATLRSQRDLIMREFQIEGDEDVLAIVERLNAAACRFRDELTECRQERDRLRETIGPYLSDRVGAMLPVVEAAKLWRAWTEPTAQARALTQQEWSLLAAVRTYVESPARVSPPVDPVVHILREGHARCRFSAELPSSWPPGHQWVNETDTALATCGGCLAAERTVTNQGD